MGYGLVKNPKTVLPACHGQDGAGRRSFLRCRRQLKAFATFYEGLTDDGGNLRQRPADN